MLDKDVLEIKQLVKDIGGLKTLIHWEQKKFILYDDSNIISNTFFTELIELTELKISNPLEEFHYNKIIIMKKV